MRPSQRPVKVYLGLWGGRLMSLNRSTALTALWSGAALKVPDWPLVACSGARGPRRRGRGCYQSAPWRRVAALSTISERTNASTFISHAPTTSIS